ncbi:RnfABCDGE type electron transport complex subunit B [Breznakiellaceae bacterium SP9]
MNIDIILNTAIFAAVVALVLGILLGLFKQLFAVFEDPLKLEVRAVLAGANCGACGFPGCDGYADAIFKKEVGIDKCSVGGTATVEKLSKITGATGSLIPIVAVVACRGSKGHAVIKGKYTGIPTCRGAKLSAGGTKLCSWGCLGFGDCIKACHFGGITMGEDGLPVIDTALCTGCKSCVAECPQGIIRAVVKKERGPMPLCNNRNPIRAMVRRTCDLGCMKCEVCVKNCTEKAIVIDKGLPLIDYDKCTHCGTCVTKCPAKVLNLPKLA